ncbi:hypothetical protein [Burkholderia sp. S171]|uniref:hypothetical protein n=1 Tax=Burkholderia sp. S171 TaxID=1641860 RepID=UPI00131E2C99|nr:hypothetical protein [Burkholderia sp. S171]
MSDFKKTVVAFMLTMTAEALAVWIWLALSDGFEPVTMLLSAIAVLLFMGLTTVVYVTAAPLNRA